MDAQKTPLKQANNENENALTNEETQGWYGSLDAEKKAAIRKLYQLDTRWNYVVLLYVASWLVSVFFMNAWPIWPVRVVGYLVIGVSIHGFFNFLHEGIHGNLFRNKKLDRVLAFLTAVPTLSSATAYRVIHLRHHRYNRTENDPNELMNISKDKRLLSVIFYLILLFGLQTLIASTPVLGLKLADRKTRPTIIYEYLFLVVFYGLIITAAISAGFQAQIIHFWVIPLFIAATMGNVRGWAEHMLTVPGHPLTQSRTVTSTPLISFILTNANFHLEHHLVPGMPWYNLPKLHVIMQEEYEKAGAFNYKTYRQFLWDAIRIGVHGLAPERFPHPLLKTAP